MRSSRQDTEKHREQIIDAAARLVREKGVDGVSVPSLMAEVGMTHGGFYRHFPSKDALAPVAFERALAKVVALMDDISAKHPEDPKAAIDELARTYLSTTHRDDPGDGCVSAALAGDMAREAPDSALRKSYVAGIEQMVAEFEKLNADQSSQGHQQALLALSTMVGAIVLSRATKGTPISEDILSAARTGITPKA
jgi:TetR/AcrR family transcriptional repressor of nem operon